MRPALEIEHELDEGRFLDKKALAIHDVTQAVLQFGKPGRVTVHYDISLLSKPGMTEPVVTIESDITTKAPKPEPHKALFFIDENGEPTTKQQRQREIGFSVAVGEPQGEVANG